MTNIFQTPNLLRISGGGGDLTLRAHFGELLAVTPIRMPGSDPFDYVVANFRGLHLEFTRQDAYRLSSGLFDAARKIREIPDYSGILSNLEDQP